VKRKKEGISRDLFLGVISVFSEKTDHNLLLPRQA
jgi:hypothetical protein